MKINWGTGIVIAFIAFISFIMYFVVNMNVNKKYDHDFRWNNFDEAGDQKYYCSELVSKLFQAFVGIETPIKRMHFQKNRDYWVKYFKGNVPDNEWGNSPGDYERSDMFYHAGEL